MLAWFFKLQKGGCLFAMIAANYFSAWVGGLFLNHQIAAALPFTLYNAWHLFWVMAVLTYLMTLVLEWPFVFFCFRKEAGGLKRSLRGNLLINSCSYVLLFGWYWLASGTTLYTRMNIVQPSQIGFPTNGIVYFISKTDGVCKFDFSSHQTEKICPLKAGSDDRLFVRPSVALTNGWDILDYSTKITICSNLEVSAVQTWRDTNNLNRVQGTWFNFGETPKLGIEQSDWNFNTGFWPIAGFQGKNQKTGEKIYFSLETPFVAWVARNATHLPGDYVVFQLGEGQICLLEVATKKIALLAQGQGPVVILPQKH